MKTHNNIFLLMLIIIFAIGCREDSIMITEEETELPESEEVTYQFLVTNEQGDPISDAQLLINTEVYTSDGNGIAITQPQKVSSLGLTYKVTAFEYESIVKRVDGADGAKISETVVLFKAVNTVIPAGGSGSVDGGGKLTLPSNLKASDGSVYFGNVTVKSKYLDPDNKDFLRSAPGNLLALNTADEYQLLASLGMYMIELYDDNGGALELPDGSSAIIEFPIADKHKNNIGSEIPLWYFDENKGIWIEDGIAKVDGGVMIAEVNHFTWWNCDLPYDFTLVCLRFLDSDGEQMSGLEVGFSINEVSFGLATTGVNGNIIAKVPIGVIFDMTYYLGGVAIGTQNAGPIVEGARKEIINTGLNLVKISGIAVDCDGIGVSNGYGYYSTDNGSIPVLYASNGSFCYYGTGVEHELVLIDINSFKIAEIFISEAELEADLTLGTVVVCGEDISTKVSGFVMIDSDGDNIGDTPLAFATIDITNTEDQFKVTVTTNENGYYELALLPETVYFMVYISDDQYVLIATGDKTPDGDVPFNDFSIGNRYSYVKVLVDEHDSGNDFYVIPAGVGTTSGTAMGDSDNDGIGDTPLEWLEMRIYSFAENETYKYASVGMDGSFSIPLKAAYMNLSAFKIRNSYTHIIDWDITPDPDGDDSHLGPNSDISVVLYDGEVDDGNNFVIDISTKLSLLCQVLEDTDFDGIGDIPVENIDISLTLKNAALVLNPRQTNQFGVTEFLNITLDNEFTVKILSTEYEVINIIDTSPDNDPFLVDGDVTKMEIYLEEGEWDAGNIFVVRKN